MKIVGLITEYNPFHNGHQYHIEMAKKITGADMAIVVMSGNFVQRGTPAIMPKHLRTKMALTSGADLVIELPVCYATGSAEYFALGAVSLLEKLGCVDYLCFGSECGDISILKRIAQIIHDEPEEYKRNLQSFLRLGDTFPLARQKALKEFLSDDSVNGVVEHPNNILGIEYIKALFRLNSTIIPVTLKRLESGYHDSELRKNFSSASAIRNLLNTSELSIRPLLTDQVPEVCLHLMEQTKNVRFPVDANDFSLLLKYRLLKESKESLITYVDVSKELANRIINQRNQFICFEQFCDLLKTKEMTFTRISRALMHILLELKKDNLETYCSSGCHAYIHILGFRKESSSVLSVIKNNASIPMLSKLVANPELPEFGKQMLQTDIDASNLYESVVTDKFKTSFINEYEQQIVIV